MSMRVSPADGADVGVTREHQHGTPNLAPGISAAAPYVSRPPSPPYISIPAIVGHGSFTMVPSYENVDPTLLGAEDLRIITQGRTQMAADSTINWDYDMRRKAQPILDFLYLGPWGAAKDLDFLRRERITMLLAVRDSRIAEIQAMSVGRTAKELGIVADHVDVAGNQELIRVFPDVARKINDHMLDIYRSQAVVPAQTPTSSMPAPADAAGAPGQMAIDKASFRRGKVLVFCESGNNRSAALVAAYIMTIFGVSLVRAIQFVNRQRFCTNFDEETKVWLRAYHDILEAKRVVANHNREADAALTPQELRHASSKRSIQETYDEMDDAEMGDSGQESGSTTAHNDSSHDRERYVDRAFFVPFIDNKDCEMT